MPTEEPHQGSCLPVPKHSVVQVAMVPVDLHLDDVVPIEMVPVEMVPIALILVAVVPVAVVPVAVVPVAVVPVAVVPVAVVPVAVVQQAYLSRISLSQLLSPNSHFQAASHPVLLAWLAPLSLELSLV